MSERDQERERDIGRHRLHSARVDRVHELLTTLKKK